MTTDRRKRERRKQDSRCKGSHTDGNRYYCSRDTKGQLNGGHWPDRRIPGSDRRCKHVRDIGGRCRFCEIDLDSIGWELPPAPHSSGAARQVAPAIQAACIFCGERFPDVRLANWDSICTASNNSLAPDTAGNRHHAYLQLPASCETTATGARRAAERIFDLFKNASYFSTRNAEHKSQMLDGWAAIIAEECVASSAPTQVTPEIANQFLRDNYDWDRSGRGYVSRKDGKLYLLTAVMAAFANRTSAAAEGKE